MTEVRHEAETGEQGLSLYLALKPGTKADLEIVAQAALHWAATLRAAAQAVDPESNISLELVDAEEGSLRLNTILDWAEGQLKRIEDGGIRHWRVKKLAIAIAAFVVTTGYPTYDFYFGNHEGAQLSEEDRSRIDELIRLIGDEPAVQEHRTKLFRTLEKDPNIRGVSVTERRDDQPRHIIPSSEFPGRGGLWVVPEDDLERTVYPVLDVTLVSPVLLAKPRSWRFQPASGLPEFSAIMRDERFLNALKSNHVREQLRIGIPMTIRLKVEEQNVGGVWVAKRKGKRASVVEVLSPRAN